MLPSILLDIIRKDIESRSAYVADKSVREANSSDISRLIDMIQALTDNNVKSGLDVKPKSVSNIESDDKSKVQVVSEVDVDLDLDDDFLDMLK